jgi:hypothetical protein
VLSVEDDENSRLPCHVLRAFDPLNRANITTAFGVHFSKGNQAAKDPEDRISGAGTLARDADGVITLTTHEEPLAFTLDFLIRDHPPIDSFVVRWLAPIMDRTDLDPAKIKNLLGRKEACSPQELLNFSAKYDDQLKTTDLTLAAQDHLGWSRRTILNKLHHLETNNLVFKSHLSDAWNIKVQK